VSPDVVARLRAAGCVFAEEEAQLLEAAAHSPAELAGMVDQRAAGLPLEHILGWAEFCGLRISVSPGVFVPRRRSEFLVAQAVAAAQRLRSEARGGDRLVVLDLCCGAGAIGVAIAAALGDTDLHAADIDAAAVACARGNVVPAGGHVYAGDLFSPLPPELRGGIDILAVNAPYVPTAEIRFMPAEARLHEPRVALDGGPDGTGLHHRVASQAADWLSPRGVLLIETSERQAPRTAQAVADGGLTPETLTDAELDATVVIGVGTDVTGVGIDVAARTHSCRHVTGSDG
jgi:release factor glutamine methyltransferase